MEGIGEGVDTSSLEVVIDEEAGVTSAFSFFWALNLDLLKEERGV